MKIRVTDHACQRYAERVEPCSLDDARQRILAAYRGIEIAAEHGFEIVRLACGARLILDGESVVTVYGRGELPRQCRHPVAHRHLGEGEWL